MVSLPFMCLMNTLDSSFTASTEDPFEKMWVHSLGWYWSSIISSDKSHTIRRVLLFAPQDVPTSFCTIASFLFDGLEMWFPCKLLVHFTPWYVGVYSCFLSLPFIFNIMFSGSVNNEKTVVTVWWCRFLHPSQMPMFRHGQVLPASCDLQ